MEIKELARKRYFAQVTVFGKCDMAACQHHARCIVIIDGTVWQLCKFCFRKLIKERNALQDKEAAES